jgi:hypothetical protein
MIDNQVVSLEAWIKARKQLLAKEQGIYEAARSANPSAPRAALGSRDQALCIRRSGREAE